MFYTIKINIKASQLQLTIKLIKLNFDLRAKI